MRVFFVGINNIVLLKKGNMKYTRHILDDQKNYKNLENFGEKRKKKAVLQLSNHKGSRRIITSSLEGPIQCLQNLSYFVPSIDTT